LALTPGTRLGPYEIASQIGVGGMGEVYKATDTNLKRAVAIKVLPAPVAADAERLARFQHEAEVLAALNHPNIAAIYGLERADTQTALVMELVEGQTLADRVARGAIPVEEALRIAKQIADALEAAHGQGIIHRDLKPANIKVRPDGTVKVLDFGLAKALVPTAADAPTLTGIRTLAGLVMGTPAYMSPEQARGEPASPQADIWSFGVVLYELVTGISPFCRSSTAETFASVLGAQPDYSALPAQVPPKVAQLIRRCLERDRKRRSQHIGDVRIELDEALAGLTTDAAVPPVNAAPVWAQRWRWAAAGIALVLLAGVGGWFLAQRFASAPPAAPARLSIVVPDRPSVFPFGTRHLAISQDGTSVAFAAARQLSIRRLAQKEVVAINVTASNPFFSPNGEWVGFFSQSVGDEGLSKVSVLGGAPVPIATTSERPAGGTWRADGTIVFATSAGLYRVSESGGEPRLLLKPDPNRKERAYAWPHFLPDGSAVLFTIIPETSIDGAAIAVLNLKTLEVKVVLKGGSAGRYASTGHLVYATGSGLKAIAFDPDHHEIRGQPVALPDVEVATTPDNGAAEFALSTTGTLIFITPEVPGRVPRTLSWVDRRGIEERLPLAPDYYYYQRISPDGTRVALDIVGTSRDIWIWDLQRRAMTKLTDGPTEDLLPVWSPDGRRVFFSSDRTGNFDVYSQAADGATAARLEFAGPGAQMTMGFTPDGGRLLLLEDFKDVVMFNPARTDRLEPLLHSKFAEWLATVSPDGHWIAYESNEAENHFEIFLRPFPDVSGRREKVSINGGRYPLWGPKGGELFYVDLDGQLMAASVTLSPTLRLGSVTKLFDWEKPPRGVSGMPYDVSPIDGRFLRLNAPPRDASSATIQISVVLNWFQELKRLAPAS
jgi:serine/threonine-protein kinase